MQKVIISGNLGKDAEVKPLEGNGRYHVSFSVAVNYSKGKGDDKKQLTQWYSVAYFSASGKIAEYLKKGAKVVICGGLELDIYKSDSGKMFVNANILATDVEIVGFVESEAGPEANVENSLPPIPSEEPF